MQQMLLHQQQASNGSNRLSALQSLAIFTIAVLLPLL
jgi:hypothetical protein